MFQATNELKLKIADRLEEVAKYPSRVPNRDWGMCILLFDNFNISDASVVRQYFKSWPKYSGNDSYPVPKYRTDPSTAYIETKDKWKGAYGRDRRDLCRHIAKKLREEVYQSTKLEITRG